MTEKLAYGLDVYPLCEQSARERVSQTMYASAANTTSLKYSSKRPVNVSRVNPLAVLCRKYIRNTAVYSSQGYQSSDSSSFNGTILLPLLVFVDGCFMQRYFLPLSVLSFTYTILLRTVKS